MISQVKAAAACSPYSFVMNAPAMFLLASESCSAASPATARRR